jgi:hypothetical protein
VSPVSDDHDTALTHPNAVLGTSHRAVSNWATPAADVIGWATQTSIFARRKDRLAVARVDPMGISDRLPTGTRTVYDPPLWSRFATANDETP